MLSPRCESAMRWAARPFLRTEDVVGMLLSWWGWGQQAQLEGKEGWQQYAAVVLRGHNDALQPAPDGTFGCMRLQLSCRDLQFDSLAVQSLTCKESCLMKAISGEWAGADHSFMMAHAMCASAMQVKT